jgi:CRISPR-associated protein Cas2
MSLKKTELSINKRPGSSPAEDYYYVLLFFDISEPKKYRQLIKILKSYSFRIQKSVFEAHLKSKQFLDAVSKIRSLMNSERFYNPNDNIRIYKIFGSCYLTVFGEYESTIPEANIFL